MCKSIYVMYTTIRAFGLNALNLFPLIVKGGVHPVLIVKLIFETIFAQQNKFCDQTFEESRTLFANRCPWYNHAHIYYNFGSIMPIT